MLTNLGNEISHHFEGIGAKCWRRLVEGLAVTESTERLAVTYDASREQVAANISALIDDLCEHRLLQRDASDLLQGEIR